MSSNLLRVKDLEFSWPDQGLPLIDHFDMDLGSGEKLFIRGASGSGKSTLLNLVAGVLKPQKGHISFLGQDLGRLSNSQRDQLRADSMGFIFQMFNLLPFLTVEDNILMSCRFSKLRKQKLNEKASPEQEVERLVQALNLTESGILKKKASDLSVGQSQRVACARALIGSPQLIIADEPTSALDADSKASFLQLLFQECDRAQSALLFVSHDSELSQYFDRSLDLDQWRRSQK